MFLKVVAILLKIVKIWKNDLMIKLKIYLQLFIFSIMSIILVQWCAVFWANQWNTSHWVKYVNIRVFSDTYFPVYVLAFCPYTGKCGSENTFTFAYLMQCPTEFIGKLRYNILLQCIWKILRMKRQTCCTDILQCIFSCSHK